MRVQHLLNDVVLKALLLAQDTSNKVEEIHTQLTVLQRQCNYRDRPLCDSLKVKSFEEIGFVEKLKSVSFHNVIALKFYCKNIPAQLQQLTAKSSSDE